MKIPIFAVLLFSSQFFLSESANILAFASFPAYSHFIILESLLKGLADRGHNVTMVSFYPQKTPYKNYNDIDVSETMPTVTNNVTIQAALDDFRSPFQAFKFITGAGCQMCEIFFKEDKIKQLLNPDIKFDLVITEIFGSDCLVGFAYKYKVPLVSTVTTVPFPWVNRRIGNPIDTSYVPNYFHPFTSEMPLSQRIVNTLAVILANVGYYFSSEAPSYQLAKEFFGPSLPHLNEIYENTSLIFTHSHFSFRESRPMNPNYIEIAGIHLRKPNPLPKDLKEIVDKAKNGVIIFSVGSVLKGSTFPDHVMDALIKTFEKLPYTILWKLDGEVSNCPDNVIGRKWLPIQDILAHPNIKLFITHGGMATTIEIVNAGVPIVGIPMFADQKGNIEALVSKGVGVHLDYYNITKESFYEAITTVLSNPRYRGNAKELSKIFNDRPQKPLETAVYWIEYVLKYKGAPHLKSSATNLYWFQLLLLDVILIIIVSICAIMLILFSCVKYFKKLLFKESKEKKL